MKNIKSIIAISLFIVSSASHANNGSYFGISYGQSTYDVTLSQFAAIDDGSIISASLDDSDSSFSLTLGKKINSNLSIEGGFLDLGAMNVDAVSDGTVFYAAGPVNAKIETSGLFFNVKGETAINTTTSLYGKIGLIMWDADISLSDSTGSASGTEDGTDMFYGFGASFDISKNYSLYIDYSLYEFDNLEVDNISVGINFGF